MSKPQLRITLERSACAPGETVRGQVEVIQGGGARELEVELRYVEHSPDYAIVGRVAATTTLAQRDLAPGASFDFTLETPRDALPGYVSAHGSLGWVVVARVDRRGADQLAVAAIEIGAAASRTQE